MAAERFFLKMADSRVSGPPSASDIRPLTPYHLRLSEKLKAVPTSQQEAAAQLHLGLAPPLRVVSPKEAPTSLRIPAHLGSVAQSITNWAQASGPRTLWLFGKSGSGKTLLVDGCLASRGSECRVTTCDRFLADWVEGFRSKRPSPIAEYKTRTRILVLEGLEVLATKAKTQDEILRTIEAIHARGGAVAVTSVDSPLVLTERLSPTLASKLSSGLVFEVPLVVPTSLEEVVNADLSMLPDEQRSALCARLGHVTWVSYSSLKAFAVNVAARIASGTSIHEIDLAELLRLTNGGASMAPKKITPQDILEKTSAIFGVTAGEVKGSRRTRHVSEARLFCYRALHELARLTQSDIADLLGRDPSSVNKGIQQIRFKIEQSPTLQRRWQWLVDFVLQTGGAGDDDKSGG